MSLQKDKSMRESISKRAEKMVCLITGRCLDEWQRRDYELELFILEQLEETIKGATNAS